MWLQQLQLQAGGNSSHTYCSEVSPAAKDIRLIQRRIHDTQDIQVEDEIEQQHWEQWEDKKSYTPQDCEQDHMDHQFTRIEIWWENETSANNEWYQQ